jgi:hypothetical protein
MMNRDAKHKSNKVMDDRQKGFERKYHLDEELAFKSAMRCAKLLGAWVAGQLDLGASDAEAYARSAVEEALADPRQERLVEKLCADLAAKGSAVDRDALCRERDRLAALARQQIEAELQTNRQRITPE